MPKSILVVDDENIVVEIAKRRLEERGFQVQTAFNGAEALERLKEKVPDLIVLDVQMPEMNGYTFLMEKNKTPEHVDIPVIVLSAYAETEALLRRHRIKDYLLKPLKLQDLIAKVVEVIGQP